jgi:hypothetical protein
MFKRLLMLILLVGGAAWFARLVEPDVRRYLEMSRM